VRCGKYVKRFTRPRYLTRQLENPEQREVSRKRVERLDIPEQQKNSGRGRSCIVDNDLRETGRSEDCVATGHVDATSRWSACNVAASINVCWESHRWKQFGCAQWRMTLAFDSGHVTHRSAREIWFVV
jgi:hypothetical protein